ncbi:MAG: UDP-N-acetylmuramoyl-tripeptide--D-alanyl-D-alanine ligase, partial [Bacillota bacterium]
SFPDIESMDAALIQVPDTIMSLHKLISYLRYLYRPVVLAITGSMGKTTTKDLLAHVLASRFDTLKSEASYNNQYGIPLTVSKLVPGCTHLVLEIGANHMGEIGYLSNMVEPDLGIITNIGWAHIGNFGSLQNTLEAKCEIIPAIREGGDIIINGDDEALVSKTKKIAANSLRVVRCGFQESNDVFVSDITYQAYQTRGIFNYRGKRLPFVLNSVGEHMICAAINAFTAGILSGVEAELILESFTTFKPPAGRFRIIPVNSNLTVIDDSYNASPDAMMSALNNLKQFTDTIKIAVLGEMKELGDYAAQCHAIVGKTAANLVSHLIVMGSTDCGIIPAAIKEGFNRNNAFNVNSVKEVLGTVESLLKANEHKSVVLVKGSRFTHMERVVLGLTNKSDIGCDVPNCDKYVKCSECPDKGGT